MLSTVQGPVHLLICSTKTRSVLERPYLQGPVNLRIVDRHGEGREDLTLHLALKNRIKSQLNDFAHSLHIYVC